MRTHPMSSLWSEPRFLNRNHPLHILDIGGWRGSNQARSDPGAVQLSKEQVTELKAKLNLATLADAFEEPVVFEFSLAEQSSLQNVLKIKFRNNQTIYL